MRLIQWTMIGATLTAICFPFTLHAVEPATRPAPAERRGGADRGRRMGPPPGQLIEQLRAMTKELDLTDEQKTKIASAFTVATEEFEEVRDNLDSMEPRERRERVEEILGAMRQAVIEPLTEPQRQTLRKKMTALRPGGDPPAGAARLGAPGPAPKSRPTTGPAPLIERLQQSFATLGLSDDQQKRVDAVLADARTQFEELREGVAAGDEAAREKASGLMMDVRRQIGEILTPEQREQVRDAMPAPSDLRDNQRRPRRGPGGNETSGGDMMDGDMKGGVMRNGDGRRRPGDGNRNRQRPRRDTDRAGSDRPGGADAMPAQPPGALVNTPAPPFELIRLDGKPVRPSTLHGRVGVIVFGSYSSPSFRQRAPEIEALAKRFGARAQFLIVYTKEAHPAADWDVGRNKDAGIAVEPHKDAAARAAQAEKAAHALKLTIPVAPDTMDDAVTTAFGTFPNGAVVLSRDGFILARQQWVDPHGLETRIEQALKTPTSKPVN